jgi:carboxysome shell carbonic anhydrase
MPHPACSTLPERSCRHPLADRAENERLARTEDTVKQRFDAIVPVLKELAGLARGEDFAERAQDLARTRLGLELPQSLLADAWVAGADVRALYAHCVFGALAAGAEQFRRDLENCGDAVQDTSNFFLDCGFHVVDISPCADGRLKGLMPYILRMPLSSFSRRTAYAGALFDIEGDVQHWVRTELRRFREGVPSTAGDGTRYLKIAVYHGSSSDPHHKGCAAHGSNDHVAMEAALERLLQFREAIENAFCCGASTDILLIGVDTDTDAIRVHVPDANGDLSVYRYVDNARIYHDTLGLDADRARLAVHDAIRAAGSAEGWGRADGEPHEGMRRMIATLLINNLSQIEYVADRYGGRYPDLGHAERYVSIGDGFEEVQIRNLAYYARLDTIEEGAADVDVGIKIFKGLNVRHGLPVPVAIHYRYDACVPGARERTVAKCRRVRTAIEGRYPQLVEQGLLRFFLSVQDQPTGSPIEEVTAS